jgi:hypothetical protein
MATQTQTAIPTTTVPGARTTGKSGLGKPRRRMIANSGADRSVEREWAGNLKTWEDDHVDGQCS